MDSASRSCNLIIEEEGNDDVVVETCGREREKSASGEDICGEICDIWTPSARRRDG